MKLGKKEPQRSANKNVSVEGTYAKLQGGPRTGIEKALGEKPHVSAISPSTNATKKLGVARETTA